MQKQNVIISQSVLSVVKSKAQPVAVVRAGRGSEIVELLETQILSTPGVKGQRLVRLRLQNLVSFTTYGPAIAVSLRYFRH